MRAGRLRRGRVRHRRHVLHAVLAPARAAELAHGRRRPRRPAVRRRDPRDLDARLPRLRRPAADARVGPAHRRGPQLRRDRVVADRRCPGSSSSSSCSPPTASATRSGGAPDDRAPRASTASTSPTPRATGPRRVVHDVSFDVQPRRGRRARRRVRLGQVHDVAAPCSGCCRRAAVSSAARSGSRARDIAGWSDRRAAGRARRAASGSSRRTRCRRSTRCGPIGVQIAEIVPHPRAARPARHPRTACSSCSSGSASTTRRCAPASTRTSSRAACASGCSSPSPSPCEPELVIADEPTQRARRHRAAAHPRPHRRPAPRARARPCCSSRTTSASPPSAPSASSCMQDGRIVEQGPTATMLDAPGRRVHPAAGRGCPGARRAAVPRTRDRRSTCATRAWPRPRTRSRSSHPGSSKTSRSDGGREPFRAVDDVSFRVRRGTTHALVGESGSGKTTTARIVSRFVTPDAGTRRARRHGRHAALAARRSASSGGSVQLVYQNPFASLDPRQTRRPRSSPSRCATSASATRRGTHRGARAELIDRVALPAELLARSPRRALGRPAPARRHRAGARARPELVVLDEAVSALDVTVQARILELLERLQGELGLSYLFISHDLAVVRRISHSVSVMRRGRIVESGTDRAGLPRPAARLHPGTARRRAREEGASHDRIRRFFTRLLDEAPAAERYRIATEQIVAAERLGFDSAWVAQHHFHAAEGGLPSPFVFLAHAAAVDERDPARHRRRHAAARGPGARGRGRRRRSTCSPADALELGLGCGGHAVVVPRVRRARRRIAAQVFDEKLDALRRRARAAASSATRRTTCSRRGATCSAASGRRRSRRSAARAPAEHGHGLLLSRTQPRPARRRPAAATLSELQLPMIDAYREALPDRVPPRILPPARSSSPTPRDEARRLAERRTPPRGRRVPPRRPAAAGDTLDELIASSTRTSARSTRSWSRSPRLGRCRGDRGRVPGALGRSAARLVLRSIELIATEVAPALGWGGATRTARSRHPLADACVERRFRRIRRPSAEPVLSEHRPSRTKGIQPHDRPHRPARRRATRGERRRAAPAPPGHARQRPGELRRALHRRRRGARDRVPSGGRRRSSSRVLHDDEVAAAHYAALARDAGGDRLADAIADLADDALRHRPVRPLPGRRAARRRERRRRRGSAPTTTGAPRSATGSPPRSSTRTCSSSVRASRRPRRSSPSPTPDGRPTASSPSPSSCRSSRSSCASPPGSDCSRRRRPHDRLDPTGGTRRPTPARILTHARGHPCPTPSRRPSSAGCRGSSRADEATLTERQYDGPRRPAAREERLLPAARARPRHPARAHARRQGHLLQRRRRAAPGRARARRGRDEPRSTAASSARRCTRGSPRTTRSATTTCSGCSTTASTRRQDAAWRAVIDAAAALAATPSRLSRVAPRRAARRRASTSRRSPTSSTRRRSSTGPTGSCSRSGEPEEPAGA